MARKCHLAKLYNVYQVRLAQLGDEAAAAVLTVGGMGYTPPFPTSWRAITEMVVSDEARHLGEAEIYVLSPAMCDVLIAAAQTLTRSDLQLMDFADLPSRSGLLVLPHPIVVKTISGDLSDARAYTWRAPVSLRQAAPGSHGFEDLPAVRMSLYQDTHGPIQPESFLRMSAEARAQGTPLPPLTLDSIRCLPFGTASTVEQDRGLQELARIARHRGAATREMLTAQGWDEDRIVGEYVPGSQVEDPDDSFTPRVLYAFWRLCEQRIAAVSTAGATHSAAVLAERAGVGNEVRVVELRATPPGAEAAAGVGREWQHRWPVRMHRVRQWYPSERRHKVIYRGPYIKGPADKPLLGGDVVRGVTR
jgi:hypothetical protein